MISNVEIHTFVQSRSACSPFSFNTVLEKYELHEFVPLVDGIRKGDLRKFNGALLDFQHRFIRYVMYIHGRPGCHSCATLHTCSDPRNKISHHRQGTYLLLEKCKTVCYRNLFKRIHFILGKPQISLGDVALAFKWLGMPIDLDEVECILANLIYKGYVRGYIAHTKRILVLSKRDPFPVSAVIPSN